MRLFHIDIEWTALSDAMEEEMPRSGSQHTSRDAPDCLPTGRRTWVGKPPFHEKFQGPNFAGTQKFAGWRLLIIMLEAWRWKLIDIGCVVLNGGAVTTDPRTDDQ